MKKTDRLSDPYHYISLGYFCSVAMDLEKLGLRTESSPFDWTISDFSGVIHAIKNGFVNFLDYDQLYQSKGNRSHYQNKMYGVWFFHDFDAYKNLKEQLPAVKQKYERRIARFYRSITEPTLFIRYISDEETIDGRSKELCWIEAHYEEILKTIKQYNGQNEIIFIANEGVTSEMISIYYVCKDENDAVCRSPLFGNAELLRKLNNAKLAGKTDNINHYQRKEQQNQKVSRKLKRKLKTGIKRLFLKEYIHNKEC